MGFKFFRISVHDDGTAEAELNSFLQCHRVLTVDRRWVDQGANSYWSFCVDYLDSASGTSTQKDGFRQRTKDYREILSPDDFAIYVKLRDLRKEIGQAEAVPVYTIFTNEQLAQFAQSHCRTKTDLSKISGVGPGRIDKYGPRFIDLLKKVGREANEADGASV